MSEARTSEELYRLLSDNGIVSVLGENGEKDVESSLRALLSLAYTDVLGSVPSPELFTVFTYPYDCNNLKLAIKCSLKGIAPDAFLLPYGTVPPEMLSEAIRKRSFSAFPSNMATAATEAFDAFAKTGSAQEIDLLLDKALFRDMRDSVAVNPIASFRTLLEIKADNVNILSAVRVSRLGGGYSFFERAYVDGGSLPPSLFKKAFEVGFTAFAEELSENERYRAIAEVLKRSSVSITEAESTADRIYYGFIRGAFSIQSGAETVAGFLAATEAEVKSVRILIAGKRLSKNAEALSGRLGGSYV